MWAIQLIPAWRREVQLGPRAAGMTRYRHSQGLPFIPGMEGGVLLPQVYALDFKTNKVRFTDDLIFSPEKTGLFQLLILPENVGEVDRLTADLHELDKISGPLLFLSEATVIIQSSNSNFTTTTSENLTLSSIARIATASEFAADSVLCKNRPPPIGYDEHRLKREVHGKKFVLVRYDRFVFAACNTLSELKYAVGEVSGAVCLLN